MIVQGGQSPNCFPKPIVDSIVYDTVYFNSGDLQDIHDEEVRDKPLLL